MSYLCNRGLSNVGHPKTKPEDIMRYFIIILSMAFLASCELNSTEVGPPGPEGPSGPVGQGFEVEANFTGSNNYAQIFSIPENIEVFDTDIVVAYLLFEVDQETGNDVWQQLPASFFFEDGELQYAFDHTISDVQLFLTGDTNLNTLGDEFTRNQIFRVAVLPVDYVSSSNIDLSNMDEVMGAVKDSENMDRIKL